MESTGKPYLYMHLLIKTYFYQCGLFPAAIAWSPYGRKAVNCKISSKSMHPCQGCLEGKVQKFKFWVKAVQSKFHLLLGVLHIKSGWSFNPTISATIFQFFDPEDALGSCFYWQLPHLFFSPFKNDCMTEIIFFFKLSRVKRLFFCCQWDIVFNW